MRKKPSQKPGVVQRPGVFERLRGYFFAGILVTAPIAITVTLAIWIIGYIDAQVVPLLPAQYNPNTYLREYLPFDWGVPGIGVIVLLLAVTLIGAFTAGLVGRWVVSQGERILDRMPVIRSLYKLTKQIFQTVLKNQSNAFRQAVLVEYPRRGVWAVAFLTADTQGELKDRLDQDMVNVFLPTTPNPTSGFLLILPREDVKVLDMSIEDAVKLIISAGIVNPGDDLVDDETSSQK